MGDLVDQVVKVGSLGLIKTDFAGDEAAQAATRAGDIQARAGEAAIEERRESAQRAQGFFEPLQGVAERGIEGSSFLADPDAQFDFLQNNPLFKLALENANQRTDQQASAGRRLSFGDTLQQLSNNVLLSSAPLIDRQREDVTNLLNFGRGVAGSRANIELGLGTDVSNLTTDIGASRAGGVVGAQNVRTAADQNALNLGLTAGGLALGGMPGFPGFSSGAPDTSGAAINDLINVGL